MDTKKLPLLRFHNKDFTVVSSLEGEKQAFYRQAIHPGKSPKEGKWEPCNGLTYCKHTSMPIVIECREYWIQQEENTNQPGMGTKKLEATARELNAAKLPDPAEKTNDPFLVNKFLQTEKSLDLNEKLEAVNTQLKQQDQLSLQEQIDKITNQKIDQKPGPLGTKLLDNLLQLSVKLGIHRSQGLKKPLVSKSIIIAILIINPLLHLGNLKAADTLQYPAKERVEMAYNQLQKMNGAQIKNLLSAIPEKQRVELIKTLPSKVLPPFIPREALAKSLNLATEDGLKKNFDKITKEEFINISEEISESTQNEFLALLLKSIEPKKEIAALSFTPG